MKRSITYAQGILEGYHHLLSKHEKVFVIGQGLWSPWYVGTTMKDLDKIYGRERIIDSPVSELGVTGAAVGAAICGYRPIVVHPRMDFMILAMDQIVNQAAKWHHMFGGQASVPVTIRSIINRGGEQGAQHSQSLHAWFAHIPGLRVVMPSTAQDARDLLIASVLSNDPVLYIDDRWCYHLESLVEDIEEVQEIDLATVESKILKKGTMLTLVGVGYSTALCLQASELLAQEGLSCEVIDLRVLNPNNYQVIIDSVRSTGNLCVVDGGWKNCGMAGEIIASVMENISPDLFKNSPIRLTLTDAPAPTSSVLEDIYYLKPEQIVATIRKRINISAKVL